MKATDIKNELKEFDYNVKDFKISVKHRGCADIYINVTVKNIMLNLDEIDGILKEKYESIDRDRRTGEILQGGNTFVMIEYDEEVMYQAIKQRKADAQKILDNLDKFECEAGYGKIFYEDEKIKVYIFPNEKTLSFHQGNEQKRFSVSDSYDMAKAMIKIERLTA
jgi:hypothetical protein